MPKRPTVADMLALEGQRQLCPCEDYLRAAHGAMRIGGDRCYCAAGLDTIRGLRAAGIPVVGHVGLIPAKSTRTGGFKAVGKTAASAMMVDHQVKDLEAAGAIGAELEVVPDRVAREHVVPIADAEFATLMEQLPD